MSHLLGLFRVARPMVPWTTRTSGHPGNALEKVVAKHCLVFIMSSKADIPVSKVGYPFVRNNPKGTHLHEKS